MASEEAKKAAQKEVEKRLAPMMRALNTVREVNDKGRQAVQAWADSKARPAPAATDTGLETVSDTPIGMLRAFGACDIREGSRAILGNGIEEDEWEPYLEVPVHVLEKMLAELVTRSQAVELLAAERVRYNEARSRWAKASDNSLLQWKERAEKAEANNMVMVRLRDSTSPMACEPDEWTAAEEVLAHLLINVVGVPDDVPYTPNQAQEVIEKAFGNLKADNAAKAARIKEWEKADRLVSAALWEKKVEALEAKLAAAEQALEPFSDHANDQAVDDTGWRDKETVKIVVSIGDLRKARAVLGGKPS